MPKFTDLTIRSLPEGIHFDEKLPGFGIRIGKHKRTWLVVKQPNRTKVRLGHFPDMSLAIARKKALVALGSTLEVSECPSFPDARAEYLAQGKWRPKTRYEVTRTLNRHFHWTKPLDKITHRDVAEAVAAIEKPAEARAAFRDLSVMMNWCVPRYLKSSPCQGLKPPSKYTPRERVLTDDELVRVWRASERLGTYGLIIQILICTGLRVGEAAKIRTEWIEGDMLVIPASVAKNSRAHAIFLPRQSMSMLITVSKLNKWHTKSLNMASKLKKKLDDLSGVTNWTVHDLRRTYATNMQRLGVRLEVTERLLNHVSGTRGGITGIYQRYSFEDEMREAVLKYEEFLTQLLAH